MRHYHARSQSYLQKRPRIRSVARSFAHRKVEGAADDRVSRACPATRYLNPRGHMQPNERTNERDCRRRNANRPTQSSLPSFAILFHSDHSVQSCFGAKRKKSLFFERRLRCDGGGDDDDSERDDWRRRVETHSRVSCRLDPTTAGGSSRRFQKAKKAEAGRKGGRHSVRLVIRRMNTYLISDIHKFHIFGTFYRY